MSQDKNSSGNNNNNAFEKKAIKPTKKEMGKIISDKKKLINSQSIIRK